MGNIQTLRRYEQGGVSIFVVVFTALMVTIVTASFVQIVLRNQQIATNNDLSQSAYDSAMAGVEDAKRALIRYRECENNPADDCEDAIQAAFDSQSCQSLESAGLVSFTQSAGTNNYEVQVGDPSQNQAYTCVKVNLDTDDVSKTLPESGVPVVIPLKGGAPFDRVKISWFTAEDMPEGSSLTVRNVSDPVELPQESDWLATTPPVMRAQLIQFRKNNIDLSQFNEGNARTLFLYPTANISAPGFATDSRMNPSSSRNTAKFIQCSEANMSDETNGYACSTTITLPNPIGGSANDREAYLQLLTIYNSATFKVELINGSTSVKFKGIQPEVDSTGRASDLFRRVRAKLSINDGAVDPFWPNAALVTDGTLCKDFFITDNPNEYEVGGCDPAKTAADE